MTCYHPLSAYKSNTKKTINGKSYITFKLKDAGFDYENINLPCGQCIGCRIERSRAWSIRCVNEASQYSANCFITLTFNNEHVKKSLEKDDFPNFIKKLRKKYKGFDYVEGKDGKLVRPIRYFMCGEYGSLSKRPHYHGCLFNFDFNDKELWSVRDGVRLYRSESLERLWSVIIDEKDKDKYRKEDVWIDKKGKFHAKKGFCTIGDVTFQSAAYVARYILKKVTGEKALLNYGLVNEETGEITFIKPEFISMSRRSGIGKKFLQENISDIYPKDFITEEGKYFKTPKYYDKIYDEIDTEALEKIKEKRKLRAEKNKNENSGQRLTQRKKVLEAKVKLLKRSEL